MAGSADAGGGYGHTRGLLVLFVLLSLSGCSLGDHLSDRGARHLAIQANEGDARSLAKLEKYAQGGSPAGEVWLSILLTQNATNGVRPLSLLRRAAAKHSRLAEFILGNIYFNRGYGLAEWEKSVQGGFAPAELELGIDVAFYIHAIPGYSSANAGERNIVSTRLTVKHKHNMLDRLLPDWVSGRNAASIKHAKRLARLLNAGLRAKDHWPHTMLTLLSEHKYGSAQILVFEKRDLNLSKANLEKAAERLRTRHSSRSEKWLAYYESDKNRNFGQCYCNAHMIHEAAVQGYAPAEYKMSMCYDIPGYCAPPFHTSAIAYVKWTEACARTARPGSRLSRACNERAAALSNPYGGTGFPGHLGRQSVKSGEREARALIKRLSLERTAYINSIPRDLN